MLAWLMLLGAPMLAGAAPPERHYTISGWSMAEGLPHPLVHVVAQDRDGFIWAGTWEGVVRFNGRSFTLFDRQNTPGMELAGVYSILPEPDGGVLFGTARNGVYRYHQGRWQALGDASARHLAASVLLRSRRDGALWFASGDRLLQLGSGGLRDAGLAAGLPRGIVLALAEDHDGALLVGGEMGLYRIAHGRAARWGTKWVGAGVVRGIRGDGAGGWLVAGDDGLRWRHADGRVEHIAAGQRVDAVALDARGKLWMNRSDGGLLRRDADGRLLPMAIPGTVNKALLVDRENLVWVGSTDGLYRVADGIAGGLSQKDGLDSDYVRTVLEDASGAYWIGQTNGLNRWAQGRMQRVRLRPGSGSHDTSVLSLVLAANGDGLWVGTYDLGVFRLDRQGRVRQNIRLGSGAQPLVRALLADPDGGLWIGGNHGLVHYRDGQLRTYLGHEAHSDVTVLALFRDASGRLWVGTDNGMFTLDTADRIRRWQPGKDVPAQFFFDFLQDPDGDLWIASDSGLLRLRNGRFRVYDHRLGLPRDKLFRVLDDGAGYLWLSSNMGVFRVSRRELAEVDAGRRQQLSVQVVDHSDGMPGSQCNGASMPAGWRAHDGTLLFPTSAGLALIDPAGLAAAATAGPPLAFERISIDGVEQPVSRRLQLAPAANRLVIGYAGMSMRAPDKLRYRYRLQGYDQGWVDAGSNTEAVYTGLPPGPYRLDVQAMAMPLDWTNVQAIGAATLEIEVQPALWQRTWVRVLAAALVVAVVGLLMWLRTASYRRRQRLLSRVIAERTEELSEKNRQLQVASYRLEHQASHDELTGLPNRRAGDRRLAEAVARAHADGRRLSVAVLDIDHFKQVNDLHGHAAGDAVLQAFGGLLAGFVAEWGLFAARFGGEEFLLCLEELDLQTAARRTNELLQRIREHAVVLEDGRVLHCTFSAGVAELVAGQAAHMLLAQADGRLLRAKQAGRDRVVAD